jgi:predicted nuclease of predicted toxin-antitoxin system
MRLLLDMNLSPRWCEVLREAGFEKPSVVQVRSDDISPERGSEILIAALQQCAAELDAGALLTVDIARARLTQLPLGS